MKINRIIFFLPLLFCLTACGQALPYNSEESNTTIAYSESVENLTKKNFVNENINTVIEKEKKELDLSDAPFGVTDIYICTMFDYNNDSHDDFVLLYSLYSQFELVIIDSQNANILLKDRIMMHISPQTEIKIYHNSDSGYLFRITYQEFRPQVSNMVETIQFINGSEACILEAVYDSDTNSFSKGYDNNYNEYNYDEYIKKQEELLNGYDYYMDLEFEIYENTFK